MATHNAWADLLTHGRVPPNASQPFVPTVRVRHSEGANDTRGAQASHHDLAPHGVPASSRRQQSSRDDHPAVSIATDAGPKRMGFGISGGSSSDGRRVPPSVGAASTAAATHVAPHTYSPTPKRAVTVRSSSDGASTEYSPTSPKRAVTVRSSSDGASAEKKSDVPHATGLGSHLSASHAFAEKTSGGEEVARKAWLRLQEKLRRRAASREPHAKAALPAAPSNSDKRRAPNQHPKQNRPATQRQPSPQRKAKELISCTNNAKSPELIQNGGVPGSSKNVLRNNIVPEKV